MTEAFCKYTTAGVDYVCGITCTVTYVREKPHAYTYTHIVSSEVFVTTKIADSLLDGRGGQTRMAYCKMTERQGWIVRSLLKNTYIQQII